MERRFSFSLWGILALGVAVSAVTAALTNGDSFDMESFRLVRDVLDHAPLHVYTVFAHRGVNRWPYPPALFPWIWTAGRIAALGGPGFAFMIRLPTILADAAIAWIVQDWLGSEAAASPRLRLAAAALISVGPAFVVIAGYHGQFDAVAILPGVLAVSLWTRLECPRRAIWAGMLIGLGGALKTVPLLLVLAVLPTARSPREAVALLSATALPVLITFLPFAIAGTLPAAHVLSYRGLPGAGDLSLAVQPNLAELAVGVRDPGASSLSRFLAAHGTVFVLVGVAGVALIGARSRASAPRIAVLLWLAVYAFGVNFFFQYLVWGLPFFLMAGYVRSVLVAELVLLVPTVLFYLRPLHSAGFAVVYAVLMIGAWGFATAAFAGLGWQLLHRGGAGSLLSRPIGIVSGDRRA